jgi:hypothetical protein
MQINNPRSNNRKEKEKIYVSAREWRVIMSAIQYALHQHKKRLQEEKNDLRRSRENNSASSRSYQEEQSEMSGSSEERHHEPKHSRRKTAQPRKEDCARSISEPLSEEEEDFIQETPEAALVAAQAYLLTTQPEPGDPREQMHQAAIKSLGLEGDKLKQKSSRKKSIYQEHTRRRSRRSQSPPSQRTNLLSKTDNKAQKENM